MKTEIRQQVLTGERALFAAKDVAIIDSIFDNGESPLKECSDIALKGCFFRWKYPLWYAKNIEVKDCTWFEMARAGVWYTKNIQVENAVIEAPKNFRRCDSVRLKDVFFSNAAETLWSCNQVTLENVTVKGDYFAMNSQNMKLENVKLDGNYSFDGCQNVEVHNCQLISKDAFWNADNVVVYDSFITGEYLGWNSKNITFINCTIESLQGLCYIDNLIMKNCKLINTTLAFEYSNCEVELDGTVDSIFNPTSGTITTDYVKELIIEKDRIDPEKTKIICRKGELPETKHPEWRKDVPV